MVLPGLGLWEVILLGAVLALTDAALGQAVVNLSEGSLSRAVHPVHSTRSS